MKLITQEMRKKTPALRDQAEVGLDNLVLHYKLFTPWANWTWYIAEADYETGECFGLVEGLETELGYFDLNELMEIRGPVGLKIERDMHFEPKKYYDIVRKSA